VLDEMTETVRELFEPAAKMARLAPAALSEHVEAYVAELARLRPQYEAFGECAPRAFALGCLHHMERGLGEAFGADPQLFALLPNASALESLTTLKRRHITKGMRFVSEALNRARGNDASRRVLSTLSARALPPGMRARPHERVLAELRAAHARRVRHVAPRRARSPSPPPLVFSE
jgi:hypothetical protein